MNIQYIKQDYLTELTQRMLKGSVEVLEVLPNGMLKVTVSKRK